MLSKLILVDMDNVLADTDRRILEMCHERYPETRSITLDTRTSHWIGDSFSKEIDGRIREIIREPGFLVSLPEIPGAVQALRDMIDAGLEVRICTSPLSHQRTCIQEKIDWIVQHFDQDFVNRLIVTRDKTLVIGDILIDDALQIEGLKQPTWEHIIYDAPYNRNVTDKKRLDWTTWRAQIIFDV